jgi:hypothetical protein
MPQVSPGVFSQALRSQTNPPSLGARSAREISLGLGQPVQLGQLGQHSQTGQRSNPLFEEEVCSICQCALYGGDPTGMAQCGHVFHSSCLGRWAQARFGQGEWTVTCPLCRETVTRRPPSLSARAATPAAPQLQQGRYGLQTGDFGDAEWDQSLPPTAPTAAAARLPPTPLGSDAGRDGGGSPAAPLAPAAGAMDVLAWPLGTGAASRNIDGGSYVGPSTSAAAEATPPSLPRPYGPGWPQAAAPLRFTPAAAGSASPSRDGQPAAAPLPQPITGAVTSMIAPRAPGPPSTASSGGRSRSRSPPPGVSRRSSGRIAAHAGRADAAPYWRGLTAVAGGSSERMEVDTPLQPPAPARTPQAIHPRAIVWGAGLLPEAATSSQPPATVPALAAPSQFAGGRRPGSQAGGRQQ